MIKRHASPARISSIRHLQHPVSLVSRSPVSSISDIQYLRHPVSPAFRYPVSCIQYPVSSIQYPAFSILSSTLISSIRFPVSGNLPSSLLSERECWESGECVMRRRNPRSSETTHSADSPQFPNWIYIWLIHLSVSLRLWLGMGAALGWPNVGMRYLGNYGLLDTLHFCEKE